MLYIKENRRIDFGRAPRKPDADLAGLFLRPIHAAAGALHTGQVSSWACAGLVVEIEAFENWIVIDGEQRVSIEREEVLGGRHVHIKFRCACGRGCRMLSHTAVWRAFGDW